MQALASQRYNPVVPYAYADLRMEQSIFSEQATGITGADVTGHDLTQQDSMLFYQSFKDSKFAAKFRNNAAPFHPKPLAQQ